MDYPRHNESYEDIPADELERLWEQDVFLRACEAGLARIVTIMEDAA